MSQITELEYATCRLEMLLAANIERRAAICYDLGRYAHAEFARDLGVTEDVVESYLSGTHPFPLKEICNIAYVLKISVKDLFDFD